MNPKTEPRVLIAGYYGFGNAGDELILRSILKEIKQSSPSVSVTVLSNDPQGTFGAHGVEARDRWSPVSVISAVWQSDALVFGGGGLLQDATGIRTLWYYLSILAAAILLRKQIWVWCVGVGPVRSPVNRRLVRWALGFCDYVSVRDAGSESELRSYGFRKPIAVLKDPVFDLNVHEKSHSNGGLPRFAFILRPVQGSQRREDLAEAFSKAASYFLKIYNAEFSLAVFQPGKDEVFLDAVLKRVKEEIPFDSMDKVHRHAGRTPDEILQFMKHQDMVVSSRYHGAVLSLMMHTPVLGVAVDPKLRHLFSDVFPDGGRRENLLELDGIDPEKLIAAMESLWIEKENFRKRSIEGLRRLNGRKGALATLITRHFSPAEVRTEPRRQEPAAQSRPPEGLLPKSRRFLFTHPFLFGLAILLPLLWTVLFALSRDAHNLFLSQKGALVLEVFARNDLRSENIPLVEEALRAIPGVREVVATSPEEAFNKVVSDPNFSIDEEWLKDKSGEIKGKATLLPWSYDLHLESWDDDVLKAVLTRVQALEVGVPRAAAISEVHYDSERWALVFGLYNYWKWIRAVLWTSTSAVLIFAGFALFKRARRPASRAIFSRSVRVSLLLGFFAGAASHALYVALLAVSFFSERFSWQAKLGEDLLFQIAAASLVIGIGLATVSDSVKS